MPNASANRVNTANPFNIMPHASLKLSKQLELSKQLKLSKQKSAGGASANSDESDKDGLFFEDGITTPSALPTDKGFYVLHLWREHDGDIEVGRQGRHFFPKGHYFYVGSAMGAGGIASRVRRHWRDDADKKMRWHIDYVRAGMQMLEVWVLPASEASRQSVHTQNQTIKTKHSKQNQSSTTLQPIECQLAQHVGAMLESFATTKENAQSVANTLPFGASDCACIGHLFYLEPVILS